MGGKMLLLYLSLTLQVCFALKKGAYYQEGPNVFCKYDESAQFRPPDGQIKINDVKVSLCTHFIYCTSIINVKVNLARDGPQLAAFRKKNPNVPLLLGVEYEYSLNTPLTTIEQALLDAEDQLTNYNLNGLEVIMMTSDDTEENDIDSEDGNNLVDVLQQIRQTLAEQYLLNINLTPKLSVAFMNSLQELSTVTNYMAIAAYDYNNYRQMRTGISAPLHSNVQDLVSNALQSVSGTIQLYLTNGISPEKIVLVIPSIGNSFALANSAINGVGAPITGPGAAGPITNTPGSLGFNEICAMLKRPGWTIHDYQKAPYAFNNNLWVSYDSPKYACTTVQYVGQHDITSVGLDITLDDFHGYCGGGPYSLAQAINKGLNRATNVITAVQNGITTGAKFGSGVAANTAQNVEYTITY